MPNYRGTAKLTDYKDYAALAHENSHDYGRFQPELQTLFNTGAVALLEHDPRDADFLLADLYVNGAPEQH